MRSPRSLVTLGSKGRFVQSRRQALQIAGGTAAFSLLPRARAADITVDLQLVMAVDASGSVDMERFNLQKQGYVDAFRNPRVLEAILSGPHRSIAVTMFQWTGQRMQAEVIPWMVIADEASAEQVARSIAQVPRKLFGGGTSISGAIDAAMPLFGKSNQRGDRMVIDISGDGSNNGGRRVTRSRDEAVSLGITINGLPILSIEPNLEDHFRDEVIGGVGSFLIAAQNFQKFGEAIVKKLVTEIADSGAGASQTLG